MTSSPGWIPVTPIKINDLPNAIKFPLARKYQDHDGSLSGENKLDEFDIPYLEGLADGGNKDIRDGAKDLIDAIRKYGEVLFIIE